MTRPAWSLLPLLLVAACQNAAPAPKRDLPAAALEERHFGSPFRSSAPPIDVAQVLQDPAPYLQQTVKCRGTVARVCQAAGCWLELRAAAGGEGLRVPMAGHSFFVSQDIVGRTATVEGKLGTRPLPEAELAHLTGEGLKATGPLFLEATAVAVR